MISRQGIFLEYTSMAKQQGKIDGVSGVPILNVPEFTRLIRELFPTSQLINDSHNRQVFSGIKVKEAESYYPPESENGKPPSSNPPPRTTPLPNGIRREANGVTPLKENGHTNGVVSYDEDSNHSQQSLDSVGGGKLSHNSVKTIKSEKVSDKPAPPPVYGGETENTPELANGKCDANSPNSKTTPPAQQQTLPTSSTLGTKDSSESADKSIHKHSNGTSPTTKGDLSKDKTTTENVINGHSDKENDDDNKVSSTSIMISASLTLPSIKDVQLPQPIVNGSIIKVTVNNVKKRLNPIETGKYMSKRYQANSRTRYSEFPQLSEKVGNSVSVLLINPYRQKG